LHNLVKKKQEKAFRELKERFIKELILAASNLDKKVRIEVDMLDYAIEEVLSIEYKDKK